MPSIEENKRLVNQSLSNELDHDAVLSSLQAEIDKHNSNKEDAERDIRRHRKRRHDHEKRRSDLRFRFKNGVADPRHKRSRHNYRRKDESVDDEDNDNERTKARAEEQHPFPREPVTPTTEPSDNAFLSSLLDALADDEAAAYWESVYSQPIHTFERPSVRTETGSLEQMNDDEYAAWVKQRMWEKNNPEIVMERDRAKRKQQEEQELKRKSKEEFMRRRQKEAWDHAAKAKTSDDEYEYVFDFESANTSTTKDRSRDEVLREDWVEAWNQYLRAWEKLKTAAADDDGVGEPSKLLPWPVLPTKPPTRPNIEAFMRNMPLQDGKTKQHVLKAERVRWHPDKIQQRFRGNVDEGTMRVVTGIFQIIDAIWAESSS